MSMTFALKGYKGKTIGVTKTCNKLEILGKIIAQGRQPQDDVPPWIVEVLKNYPEIETITFSTKNSGHIYYR